MQLSLQARVMKKVCGCLFLFLSFSIFLYVCVFVLIEISVPVYLGDVCCSLFLFRSYVPKEKKEKKEIKHLCIVHFHCHATSYVMVTQSIIIRHVFWTPTTIHHKHHTQASTLKVV